MFGRLDILVNNAAIIEFRPLEGITEECFYKQFNVNLLGPIFATQSAVKHPRPEEGSVVNISSGAAIGPQPGGSSVYRGAREHRGELPYSLLRATLPDHGRDAAGPRWRPMTSKQLN